PALAGAPAPAARAAPRSRGAARWSSRNTRRGSPSSDPGKSSRGRRRAAARRRRRTSGEGGHDEDDPVGPRGGGDLPARGGRDLRRPAGRQARGRSGDEGRGVRGEVVARVDGFGPVRAELEGSGAAISETDHEGGVGEVREIRPREPRQGPLPRVEDRAVRPGDARSSGRRIPGPRLRQLFREPEGGGGNGGAGQGEGRGLESGGVLNEMTAAAAAVRLKGGFLMFGIAIGTWVILGLMFLALL